MLPTLPSPQKSGRSGRPSEARQATHQPPLQHPDAGLGLGGSFGQKHQSLPCGLLAVTTTGLWLDDSLAGRTSGS